MLWWWWNMTGPSVVRRAGSGEPSCAYGPEGARKREPGDVAPDVAGGDGGGASGRGQDRLAPVRRVVTPHEGRAVRRAAVSGSREQDIVVGTSFWIGRGAAPPVA